MNASPLWTDQLAAAAAWSLATIVCYLFAKALYRRWHFWWLMPHVLAPLMLGIAAYVMDESYHDYIRGTGWLAWFLGPATVAFAVPIYEQRDLIRRYWAALLAGMAAGSCMSYASSWLLATILGIDGAMRLSLLPRSVSVPFAMEMSHEIGGTPELTAVFAVITGVFGAAAGGALAKHLRLRSTVSSGALFGVAAHGAGTARAHQIGAEEGAVAGLAMVLAGVANVAVAPVLLHFVH